MTVYPLSALRAVAIRAQGLHAANAAESQPNRDTIYNIIEQIGCIQIDRINVIRRSHYLVLWSRLGRYDPSDLDALSSPLERHLFEGCAAGPAVSYDPQNLPENWPLSPDSNGIIAPDFDRDRDIDLRDFAIFENSMIGP